MKELKNFASILFEGLWILGLIVIGIAVSIYLSVSFVLWEWAGIPEPIYIRTIILGWFWFTTAIALIDWAEVDFY